MKFLRAVEKFFLKGNLCGTIRLIVLLTRITELHLHRKVGNHKNFYSN